MLLFNNVVLHVTSVLKNMKSGSITNTSWLLSPLCSSCGPTQGRLELAHGSDLSERCQAAYKSINKRPDILTVPSREDIGARWPSLCKSMSGKVGLSNDDLPATVKELKLVSSLIR